MAESEDVTLDPRVNAKVDDLLAQLKELSGKLDQVSEVLTAGDRESVRHAFLRPGGADHG